MLESILGHKKTGFFFDLDGTLIDGAPDIASALNFVLNEKGLPMQPFESITSWIGNGTHMLVERALRAVANQIGEPEDEVVSILLQDRHDAYVARYASHVVVDTFLYDGVREYLNYLVSNNALLACVTNKPSYLTRPILEHFGLINLFQTIICIDDLPKAKPEPEPLWEAQMRLGLTREACVMIGDSKNDILAASRAGIQSIAVTYGFNHGEDIRKTGADKVIDSMRELIE